MPDNPLWARLEKLDPVLVSFPERLKPPEYDLYRAIDRLAGTLFTTFPRQLDRARRYRNLYDDAVK